MSVRAKTKAKKTGKESAKKTDLEHEEKGGVESKGAVQAPVLACTAAHSPSSAAFLAVQILQTQNS
eukprot:91557-Rhodomonas_salina.1